MSVIFSYWSLHRKIYKLGEYIMGSIITIFYPTKNHNALECFPLELYFYSCIQNFRSEERRGRERVFRAV